MFLPSVAIMPGRIPDGGEKHEVPILFTGGAAWVGFLSNLSPSAILQLERRTFGACWILSPFPGHASRNGGRQIRTHPLYDALSRSASLLQATPSMFPCAVLADRKCHFCGRHQLTGSFWLWICGCVRLALLPHASLISVPQLLTCYNGARWLDFLRLTWLRQPTLPSIEWVTAPWPFPLPLLSEFLLQFLCALPFWFTIQLLMSPFPSRPFDLQAASSLIHAPRNPCLLLCFLSIGTKNS
ncbi:hypothetical protein FA13DRAFT_67984 [Coprinellus micaceus]|uniref:Uncharacterized protein n=1 Tax=Coprinellus micaceus TaxID=71717 RepID=A0A4Y7TIW4_COPMI|nr:hypothetical protein FA13DRAFT_67984 [Coprinellus micaceus]